MEHIDKVQSIREQKKKDENTTFSVSPAVIRRLPRYHRYLGELLRQECLRISSAELSRTMGVTASQIRQDLNCFGGFGQQGYGYNVKYLYQKISELLGTDENYTAIILGAGNLGRALITSHMFERRGVRRLAMFDVDPKLIGTRIADVPIYDIAELEAFCAECQVDIGVLTTPKEKAESVANRLVEAGVKGIWNFSNMELGIDNKTCQVQNIHLGDALMTLCYALKCSGKENEKTN